MTTTQLRPLQLKWREDIRKRRMEVQAVLQVGEEFTWDDGRGPSVIVRVNTFRELAVSLRVLREGERKPYNIHKSYAETVRVLQRLGRL